MGNKKKFYDVPTRFVFDGKFRIKANSQEQADDYVQKHCGLVLGGPIHTTLPDEDVDWEFNVHPEKIAIKKSKKITSIIKSIKRHLRDYHDENIDDVIPICDDLVYEVGELLTIFQND